MRTLGNSWPLQEQTAGVAELLQAEGVGRQAG